MKQPHAATWRVPAFLLALAMLFAAVPLGLFSSAAGSETKFLTEWDLEPGLPEVVYAKNVPTGMESNLFWDNLSFLQYKIYPADLLVYNRNDSFQWRFGYNRVYDFFMWTMNVYADCVRSIFTYKNRDWLVQLWKGAYASVLCTGGEIGLYSKPARRLIGQYDAMRKPEQWIGMEMELYRDNVFLFRRPFNYTWWCTGYQLGHLPHFWKKPRSNVTMVCRLKFYDDTMAALCAQQLENKGFLRISGQPSLRDADSFSVSGDTVRIAWKNITESFW